MLLDWFFWPDGGLFANQSKTGHINQYEPALPALSYGWQTNYAAVLAPPVAIQQKAHAACVKRQFVRAFMTSLSFENDQATAVFSCRGGDL